jgi:hypothetical protein
MLYAIVAFAAGFAATDCKNKEFDQCGGSGFSGDTCCPSYDDCNVQNAQYSQCQPKNLCLTPQFGQCGGSSKGVPIDKHHTCCPASFDCVYTNPDYSQCQPSKNITSKCGAAYAQCGGDGWKGPTCCIPGYKCTVKDAKYYSGCEPVPICSNARYGQCGGTDGKGLPWNKANGHDDCCPDGFACTFKSQYFSQCVKKAEATAETLVAPVTKVASEDVADATCAAPYYTCAGRSQSGFLPKALPCCKAGYDCVPWGEDFSQCRETAYAKCSKDGEWCYNTEGSHIAAKACCNPAMSCKPHDEYTHTCQ